METLRLQDILGKQNFHENMKELFESLADTINDSSRDITKTTTETSIENNNTLSNLNDKLLEILNVRGILASYLFSPLSINTSKDHTGQIQ